MNYSDYYGEIYETVLAGCRPFQFPAPWDFVRPRRGCSGPVADPAGTLAALRQKFPAELLSSAGVVEAAPGGEPRLPPGLTDPAGAVVALRGRGARRPFALLTKDGILPAAMCPIRAALGDRRTAALAESAGVLLASPQVVEVALLRALGLPAASAPDLARAGLDVLRRLDADFAVPRPTMAPTCRPELARGPGLNLGDGPDGPAAAGGAAAAPPSDGFGAVGRAPRGPVLALVGWSLLPPAAGPTPWLRAAGLRLAGARRRLGLALDGVAAWIPSKEDLETILYRLGVRNARLVREALREGLDDLTDLEALEDGGGPGGALRGAAPGYMAARADLLAALADGRAPGRAPRGAGAAARAYEAAVRDEVAGPLRRLALASGDPVFRAAGVELADVSEMMQLASPLLVEQLAATLEGAPGPDGGPALSELLAPFLSLSARQANLLRDLARWGGR